MAILYGTNAKLYFDGEFVGTVTSFTVAPERKPLPDVCQHAWADYLDHLRGVLAAPSPRRCPFPPRPSRN